jgi:hypothetical protein
VALTCFGFCSVDNIVHNLTVSPFTVGYLIGRFGNFEHLALPASFGLIFLMWKFEVLPGIASFQTISNGMALPCLCFTASF